jgi:hypothetical protein
MHVHECNAENNVPATQTVCLCTSISCILHVYYVYHEYDIHEYVYVAFCGCIFTCMPTWNGLAAYLQIVRGSSAPFGGEFLACGYAPPDLA